MIELPFILHKILMYRGSNLTFLCDLLTMEEPKLPI